MCHKRRMCFLSSCSEWIKLSQIFGCIDIPIWLLELPYIHSVYNNDNYEFPFKFTDIFLHKWFLDTFDIDLQLSPSTMGMNIKTFSCFSNYIIPEFIYIMQYLMQYRIETCPNRGVASLQTVMVQSYIFFLTS